MNTNVTNLSRKFQVFTFDTFRIHRWQRQTA